MRHPRALLAFALALFAIGAPSDTAAQVDTSAIGLTLGWSVHGNLTPGLGFSTEFEPGWIAGLQYEHWIGSGRAGIRVNTLFTQRLLDSPSVGDYNVFMADVDVLLRILPVRASRMVSPFAAVGLGATHYGSVAGSQPLGGGVYGEKVTRPHVLASLGADIATPGAFGVRVELGDKIVFPSVGYSPSFNGIPNVHNLLATVALKYRIGQRRDTGAPAPRPAATPEPEPTPAPQRVREEPPAPSPAMDSLKLEVDSLQTRVASQERQVDSLQSRIEELRSRAAEAQTADTPSRTSVELGRYTVQVSAFLESERADSLAAELRARGLPAWRWDAVTRNRTFSRVRVGALRTREEGERLGRLLEQELGLNFWVDRIDAAEDVPANAVERTLRYLDARR